MNAVALVRRLHRHRMWTNRNLLEAAGSLSDEQRRRSFAIGQGSIWKTLTHLMGAEYVWLEVLTGNEAAQVPGDVPGKIPGNQEAPGGAATLDELATRWAELDRRWEAYLATLTDEALDEVVHRTRTLPDLTHQRFAARRADVLLHVCTHAQHTVAQFVNMLRQLGLDAFPATSLMDMARREPGAS